MTRKSTPDQIFVQLVDAYLDRVYRYLCNLTRDDDTARDLCHETFLRLRKQAALGILSEENRTVFLLSEVEGLKYEQIAEVLGISMGTVAFRKFNANRALREEMKRMGHELS